MSSYTIPRNPAMSLPSRCHSGRKEEHCATNSLERWIVCENCMSELVVHAEEKFTEHKTLNLLTWKTTVRKIPYKEYFLAPRP